jgi:hypothetical protein
MTHPCEIIYSFSGNKVYGNIEGVCRITGKESEGLKFKDWVKSTFTDLGYLKPGSIISNEALFCFDEASTIIRDKTGKEKLQRFRTYSHIVNKGIWSCFTKAHKKEIYQSIIEGAELICLTDSGQKHVLFKHKIGMWQLDELFITPDIYKFKILHFNICELMKNGFSQAEIISGHYIFGRVHKCGIENWKQFEDLIKKDRGSPMFDFAAWMLFIDEDSKKKIQDSYKKQDKHITIKKELTIIEQNQITLW